MRQAAPTAKRIIAILYFRTSPVFETGDSRYLWLNDLIAVGIGGAMPGGVKYELFEVL